MREYIAVPKWVLESPHPQGCNYYLLRIEGGVAEADGCHSDPSDVAKAKHLIESLNCITKAPDRRYVMIRVEEVEGTGGPINQESVDALNTAHAVVRGRRP